MPKQHRILVVEDDLPLNQAMQVKLTHEGFAVTGLRNGELGLNSALNCHPDLIVLDMIMPHMGGIEMLRLLRKDVWGKSVPVIILTNVGNIEDSYQVYADEYLTVKNKSETKLEELCNMIRERLKE